MIRAWSTTLVCLLLGLVAPAAAEDDESAPQFSAADLEFFEKQVRPILAERCYECHSAKVDEPKGGLRLDSRGAILQGGDTGPAAEPGDPAASLLIDAVNYGDTYQMPPKSKLPDAEIAVLTKWVDRGAPWPAEAPPSAAANSNEFDLEKRKASHWAWQPMRQYDPPDVADRQWPQQDLDRFILARLEAKGLSPAPPADRRALIRRAYFAVVGLPPSPEEVEAFVADASPQAFEKVVDDLLDSPHFGERWARHWLDLVRYAETYGHEFDYEIPHAWRYRDYLIRAFNADVPYDRLVMEHIAGDLLEDPRRRPTDGINESPIGAGFWFLGEATHAPVDVRGDEATRVDNQLDVMSKTFLAMTVACARCHDHKFDAISTKDYYSLAGFLQSSHRHEARLDPHGQIASAAARLRGLKAQADELLTRAVAEPADDAQRRIARYLLAAMELYRQGDVGDSEVQKYAAEQQLDAAALRAWLAALTHDDALQASHPLFVWRGLADRDGELDQHALTDQRKRLHAAAGRANAYAAHSPLIADFEGETYGDWLAYGEAIGPQPTAAGEWNRCGAAAALPAGTADSGAVSPALRGVLCSPTFTITHQHLYYRLAGRDCQVRLVVDGYFMNEFSELLFKGFKFDVDTKGEFVWHRQAQDVGRYIGHRAHIEIIDSGDGFAAIDEIRFSNDNSAPPPSVNRRLLEALGGDEVDTPDVLAARYGDEFAKALAAWRSGNCDADQAQIAEFLVNHGLADVDASVESQLAALSAEMSDIEEKIPQPLEVLSIVDGSGEDERIHIRGNHKTLGEAAPRRMLEALGGAEASLIEQGSGRLELARQIADPTNPLTARVMVNRVWHHLFGRGIVASVDNFGVLGQSPTHPELLDFLALEFVREGWSIKRLIRTLMLSSTYQMASTQHDSRAEEIDPQNLLWRRMRIRRLEGEAVRDAILTVSGRLDRSLFGPSTPVHLTEFMQGRGRPKESGPLDGEGRRSIYTIVRRNFLPPMMLAFDAPTPLGTVGRRNVSNVPAQALILMNDPFVVEQSKIWAQQLLREEGGSSEDRISLMYEQALSRPPSDEEQAAAQAFLRSQAEEYGISFDENSNDERLWADLCHVMWNVKEFIFIR